MMKKRTIAIPLAICMMSALLQGCQGNGADHPVEIEIVQYKPEATKYFEQVEQEFNEAHPDIKLTISSPADATSILRTRFIREDYPDIIGVGGDINYSYFLDADILMDISDFKGLENIKESYLKMDKALEFVPREGVYAVPYVGNAAGILYNREMFQENGWNIPTTWEEFTSLCETIKAAGKNPLYFGLKDTWTALAPWNALAVTLTPEGVCRQVNQGKATFTEEYSKLPDKMLKLLEYGQGDVFAYGYNDACTAFAKGESAMFTIGSYAVPQILSVNPDMDIDSFVFPASSQEEDNVLNSGIDLQFCVTAACENKDAAYEVLNFLIQKENMQSYIDNQNAVPCLEGEFELAPMLDGMKPYIEAGKMLDYQDHYYPSEMAVDAQIQTFLIKKDKDAFLKKFDKDWLRYNEDIIAKVKKYEAENAN